MADLIAEDTIDDLLQTAISLVLQGGHPAVPSKGATTEVSAVTLVLRNPRARLSRSLERGRVISPLGELCWYLAGADAAEFISYYLAPYAKYAEGGIIPGAYGPRLFAGPNQLGRVIHQLREKPDSRRAVVPILSADDYAQPHEDLPCTVSLQFLRRAGVLDLIVYMRSNDLFTGFIHDVFSFTMLQELVAADLGVKLGTYTQVVGSLHLYDRDRPRVEKYLSEGWQSPAEMPSMPDGSPWESVSQLLAVEAAMRTEGPSVGVEFPVDPYWADLARLLAAFAGLKRDDLPVVTSVRAALFYDIYRLYLDDRILANEAAGEAC